MSINKHLTNIKQYAVMNIFEDRPFPTIVRFIKYANCENN